MERLAHLHLSENQQSNYEKALLKSEPFSFLLTYKAMNDEPNTYILMTSRNINKLEKASKMKKGTNISMSKSNVIANRRKVYKKEPNPEGEGIWSDIWKATKHVAGEVFDNVIRPTGDVLVQAAKKVGRKGAAKLARVACDAASGAAIAAQPELVTFAPAAAATCEALASAVAGEGCMCEDANNSAFIKVPRKYTKRGSAKA